MDPNMVQNLHERNIQIMADRNYRPQLNLQQQNYHMLTNNLQRNLQNEQDYQRRSAINANQQTLTGALQGIYNAQNHNPISSITQDLAPKALSYANNLEYYTKTHGHLMPAHHTLGTVPLSENHIAAMQSERQLLANTNIPKVPIPLYPVGEQNSCFYSCCPIQCCRCRKLAYSCGGCCSSQPRMPGGGCCGCLGLSSSSGGKIPPPGVLPPTYGALGYADHGSPTDACCDSCCGGFESDGGSRCCAVCGSCRICCPWKNNQKSNFVGGPLESRAFMKSVGPLPLKSIYQNPSWLPAMGSEKCCCYCC